MQKLIATYSDRKHPDDTLGILCPRCETSVPVDFRGIWKSAITRNGFGEYVRRFTKKVLCPHCAKITTLIREVPVADMD